MSEVCLGVLAWWASTGVVLALVWAPRRYASMITLAATLLAACAFMLAHASARHASAGFVAALVIWGWQELLFLQGLVTGPRRSPMTPGARGFARFAEATRAVIHHELALVGCAVLLFVLARDGIALPTFLLLWAMRLAAKLNLFFGVRRTNEELVPPHLRYLLSYFRRDRPTLLLPLTVSAGLIVACLTRREPLLATLAALGALEHVFMWIPLPDGQLWKWILPRDASLALSLPRRGRRR